MLIYKGKLSIVLEEDLEKLKEQIEQLEKLKDTILHLPKYHLLDGKTQMVEENEGSTVRSRLVHSINVACICKRTIGTIYDLCSIKEISETEIFKLNKKRAELEAEIVGLIHDLGHTPFGHTAESVVDEFMQSITDEATIRKILERRKIVFGEEYEEAQGHTDDFCGSLSFEHNEQSVIEFCNILEANPNEFDKINKEKIIKGILSHSISRVPQVPDDLIAQIARQADKVEYRNADSDEVIKYMKFTDKEQDLLEYSRIPLQDRISKIINDMANEATEKGEIPDDNDSLRQCKKLRRKYENVIYFLDTDGKRSLLTGENRERQQMIYKKLLEYYYNHPEKIPTKVLAYNNPINKEKQNKRVLAFDSSNMQDITDAELAISYVNTYTNTKCMSQYIRLVKERVLKGPGYGIEPITAEEIEERKQIQIEELIDRSGSKDVTKGNGKGSKHTYGECLNRLRTKNRKFVEQEITDEARETIKENREKHEKENEQDELLWFAVKNADAERAKKERKVREFTQNLVDSTPKRIEMKEEDLEL